MNRSIFLAAMAVTAAACLLGPVAGDAAEPLPIFDAHLHYSHDAWEMVPPSIALELLRKAGVRRALVSSSDDDGQQRLVKLASDVFLPSLRPYRRRGEISSWVRSDISRSASRSTGTSRLASSISMAQTSTFRFHAA
jgi:hypothetical protein